MSSDTSYKAAGTFGFREIILHWLTHVKLSRIILLVTLILVIVPLITHYYLSKVERDTSETDIHRSRLKLEAFEDLSSLKASELKFRIEEMLRIKDSVSLELRDLEARRQRLQAEVSNYNQRIEELKTEMLRQQTDLERLKISVEQAQVAQREAIERNSPELALPKRLLPPTSSLSETLPPPMEKDALMCRMHRCFDYSRCALTSGLPVYLYDPESYQHLEPDPFLRTTVAQTLGYNPHFTPDPAQACLFIVLVGDVSKEELQRTLPQLPYWRGDGRNHVLLHLTRGPYGGPKLNIRNLGRAMIAQTSAVENEFRLGFDILVPPAMGPPGGDVWQECAPMLPARRRVLLSYQGELQARLPTEELDQFVVSHLQGLIRSTTSDRFILNFSCPRDSPVTAAAQSKSGEWLPCGTEASRSAVLRSSTYTLILAPSTTNLLATPLILSRFSEALKHGAIPVLLGDHLMLPFAETLVWRKAVNKEAMRFNSPVLANDYHSHCTLSLILIYPAGSYDLYEWDERLGSRILVHSCDQAKLEYHTNLHDHQLHSMRTATLTQVSLGPTINLERRYLSLRMVPHYCQPTGRVDAVVFRDSHPQFFTQ
ncbi:hypothetical protein B566_EDAN017311 [Ephemera danica]|nr:hypothetical protein B566_EDAN017311 [Ephemera danica]